LSCGIIGVADYLSPEMITDSGHSFTHDWWSLGIIIYEMMVGFPPFYSPDKSKIKTLIKTKPVFFPDPLKHCISFSEPLKDLVNKLLDKDKTKRLGAKGGEEVLEHPWF
jgi:serine/threonine protein kinase